MLSPTSSPNSSSERPFDKLVANGDAFSFGGLPACRFIASNRILYANAFSLGKITERWRLLSKNFYEEHKTIQFDTLTEQAEYEIVAVFKTVAYSSEGFRYYDFVDAENEEDFNSYVGKCKELALYDTGVTAEYGDRLITLSTCEYSAQNGRLVVVAKKVG